MDGLRKLAATNDTIIAPATAPGIGAIAVIRLSGADAIAKCSTVFTKNLNEVKSHTLHFGNIIDGERIIDEVLVSVFKAPHSYTAENTIEISCHGSPYIQQEIIKLFLQKGVRMAEPGEFTLRAYYNGKLDLSQAEAVADLIHSTSEAEHQVAISQIRGGFSNEIKKLREEIIRFASLIELELDFSEEDVEFADRAQFISLVNKTQAAIKKLIDSFAAGNVIKNGVPVAIVGKPNVGKSTLLNALLNEERAIVSSIAGTTRDTIEDEINIKGMKFRFIDTAGIRDTTDEIENLGIEKTFEKIAQASIVLYLVDPATPQEEIASIKKSFEEKADSNKRALIFIFNKTDIHTPSVKEANDVLYISAKEKKGIEKVSEKLVSMVNIGQVKIGDVIVSNSRHYDALVHAQQSLDTVLKGLQSQLPTDLIAIDIRTAMFELGTITGEVSTDDLLESIFRNFCIGK
ncbi:MAG: tRNA uridine-5-carboxymethylaminomethyl(34) synthesis GTPase MnmE [Flavobacteriales bacterium]